MPKDWLERMSLLCWVGHKTLSQSNSNTNECESTINLWRWSDSNILWWWTSVCRTVEQLTTVIISGVNHGHNGNVDTATRCICTEEANESKSCNGESQRHSTWACNVRRSVLTSCCYHMAIKTWKSQQCNSNKSVSSFIHQLTMWHCSQLLMSTGRAAVDRYVPAGSTAANPPHAAAAVVRWDRQTNGWTPYTDPVAY